MARDYKESIRFISLSGRRCEFKTEPNLLNNSQMWWIEPYKQMFAGTVKQARDTAAEIRKNCGVIE